MSNYSNVIEQDLLNLRKLAEQQQNQRPLKIKRRFLNQTHDIKLAESLSSITKKLKEVKESNQKLGEDNKENSTSQPAIKHTSPLLPIENEQIQLGVIYDTSIHH